MDAKHLVREADRLHGDASQKRQVASRMTQNASGHHDIGLDDKASVEEKQAATLEQDAQVLDQQAEQLEAQAEANWARAKQLDKREEDVRREYEHQLKDIAEERRRLVG